MLLIIALIFPIACLKGEMTKELEYNFSVVCFMCDSLLIFSFFSSSR